MSGLIQHRVKSAGQKRGFAVMRLLTHWAEIVGEDIAKMTTPVKIGYSRDGFGAVLTVLTTGAQAPMVQMQVQQIRDRVNACYGYSAISRVALTQTAPVGFHEGRTAFEPALQKADAQISEEVKETSARLAGDVEDDGLRSALERMAQNVLSRESASRRNTK
ncbi:MAG: DciA family protein [Pseudomonadota bacterium]